MDLKENWLVVPLEGVIRLYVEGLAAPPGRKIVDTEYYVDSAKGRVIVRVVSDDVEST